MIPRTANTWFRLAAFRCAIAEAHPHFVPLGARSHVNGVPLVWAASSTTLHCLILVAAVVCAATVVGLLRRQPASRARPVRTIALQDQYRLFEYLCKNCGSKRPIQYFCRDGVFLPQEPRAVCGCCNVSSLVEPFKTVDYSCPCCKKWQKARLLARPVHLNTYNVSRVHCSCGFHGEATVGQLIDVICKRCSNPKRELKEAWAADAGETVTYCESCQEYTTCFAKAVKRTRSQHNDAIVFTCKVCSSRRPIKFEDLLRSEGLVCCSVCSWVGYPEPFVRSSGKACEA
jgi:hypothetical protein